MIQHEPHVQNSNPMCICHWHSATVIEVILKMVICVVFEVINQPFQSFQFKDVLVLQPCSTTWGTFHQWTYQITLFRQLLLHLKKKIRIPDLLLSSFPPSATFSPLPDTADGHKAFLRSVCDALCGRGLISADHNSRTHRVQAGDPEGQGATLQILAAH